ncbi:MAG: acyltransferase [Crocinitomicaceae bacterium]
MRKIQPYFYSIDLLRGCTALLICLYHFINHQDGTNELFSNTEFIKEHSSILVDSVFIFFMISGFVIPLSMLRQNFELKKFFHFLLRRWIRIEIPYLFSLFTILFIGYLWSFRGIPFQLDWNQLMHHFFYSVGIFQKDWLNPIYWTLAIEFQFYILIALIFPILKSKQPLVKYGSLLLLSGISIWLIDFRFVFAFLPLFVVGLLYLFYLSEAENKMFHLGLLFLVLMEVTYLFSWISTLYILVALAIIEWTQLSAKNLFVRFGKMGYSFYLMHGVFGGSFLVLMQKYISNSYVLLISAIVFAILCSSIFYLLIEKPSQKLSKRISYSK